MGEEYYRDESVKNTNGRRASRIILGGECEEYYREGSVKKTIGGDFEEYNRESSEKNTIGWRA